MVGFEKYEQLVRKRMEQATNHLQEILIVTTNSRDVQSKNSKADIDSNCPEANRKNGSYITQKKSMVSPKLYLELRGERSLLSVESSRCIPLTLNCVQSLILQALLGRKAPQPPVWCNLLRNEFIPQVTVIIIHGLGVTELSAISKTLGSCDDQNGEGEPPHKKMKRNLDKEEHSINNRSDIELVKQCLPNSFGLFPLQLAVESSSQNSDDPPVESPSQNGDDPMVKSSAQHCSDPVLNLFSDIPMSTNLVENLKKTYQSLFEAWEQKVVSKIRLKEVSLRIMDKKIEPIEQHHSDQMNRVELLLSLQEMADFRYPLQLEGTDSHYDPEFVSLHQDYEKVTPQSPMYGIDCEMCKTIGPNGITLELTRVSVVDEHLNVVYSSFVKPGNRILNYLTRYSGVTEDHLLEVETSLMDVQRKLRKLLPKDCILVGHSLDSDLRALKLFHPYVIDTSRIYNLSGNRNEPCGLKKLTKLFLKRDIQTSDIYGHDPSEDAIASLELALLKLRNGKSFGDTIKEGKIPSEEEQLRAHITVSNDKRRRTFSSKKTCEEYKSNVFKIIKMENCMSAVITTEKHSFGGADTITRVDDVGDVFTSQVPPETKLIVRHCTVFDTKIKKLVKKLKIIDQNIKIIHESMPEKSLLITFLSPGPDSVVSTDRSHGVLLVDLVGQERNHFSRNL